MALIGKTINGRLIISDNKTQNKYRAIPTIRNGTKYHSHSEAEYCEGLKHLQRAGEISGLRLQVPFDLVVNGQKICNYIADATYIDNETNDYHVIDVKGFRTKEFRLKKKLMLACLGIVVEEIKV